MYIRLSDQFGSVFVVEPNVSDNLLPTFQSRTNTRFETKNILDNLCIQKVESID
jgi:hypothetical protein